MLYFSGQVCSPSPCLNPDNNNNLSIIVAVDSPLVFTFDSEGIYPCTQNGGTCPNDKVVMTDEFDDCILKFNRDSDQMDRDKFEGTNEDACKASRTDQWRATAATGENIVFLRIEAAHPHDRYTNTEYIHEASKYDSTQYSLYNGFPIFSGEWKLQVKSDDEQATEYSKMQVWVAAGEK